MGEEKPKLNLINKLNSRFENIEDKISDMDKEIVELRGMIKDFESKLLYMEVGEELEESPELFKKVG